MDRYELDTSTRTTMIRMLEGGLPEILHKGDTAWSLLSAGGRDDIYARAVYLGQGCWEDLHEITPEEAEKILNEWGFDQNETYQFRDVFEFQETYPSKPDREKVLRNMTNEDIDKLIATCGTNQGKAYYASFKRAR